MSSRAPAYLLVFSLLPGGLLPALAEEARQPFAEAAELRISCDPPAFSPNGDRVKDQAFIQPVLTVPDTVRKWQLLIESRSGRAVKKMGGYDDLPALFVWGGEDQKGNLVEEGSYLATLKVWGRESGKLSAEVLLSLDTSPPSAAVSLSTRTFSLGSAGKENPLIFTLAAEDTTGIDHWEFAVSREGGSPVRSWRSTGPVAGEISWDGREERFGVQVPSGRYTAGLSVWDAAGNTAASPEAALQVEAQAPPALTPGVTKLRVEERPEGAVVRLSAGELFDIAGPDPSFKEGARELLDELGYLLGSYPGRNCALDGFSVSQATAGEDANVSSVWAWKVYSALVKAGADARRLEVKGRGRERHPFLSLDGFEGIVATLKERGKEGE